MQYTVRSGFMCCILSVEECSSNKRESTTQRTSCWMFPLCLFSPLCSSLPSPIPSCEYGRGQGKDLSGSQLIIQRRAGLGPPCLSPSKPAFSYLVRDMEGIVLSSDFLYSTNPPAVQAPLCAGTPYQRPCRWGPYHML